MTTNPDRYYHTLERDDGSTCVYYTLPNDPAHYILYDTLDDLESQIKSLAAKIAQQPNAADLRRLFEQTYLENRLQRVEDKLRTAKRLSDCPRMSE